MSEKQQDEQTDSNDAVVTLRRSQIRGIEKKAKEYDSMIGRLEAAERELAFAKAGLPVDDKRISYFVKGYDGELDAEAIRAAATDAGFLSVEESEPTASASADKPVADAIYSASSGAGAVQPTSIQDAMLTAMQERGTEGVMDVLRQHNFPLAED
jgi:hypothetical protein